MVSVRTFGELPHVSVKGKLLNSIDHWKSLGAPDFIFNIIRVGCKIPFISTSSRHHYRNNASAVKSRNIVPVMQILADFVGEAVLELLRDNRIEELFFLRILSIH